ncbi:MAG: hypothetical protein HW400_240 [Candidatus Levybacteria bacterium]|nr:hypothetical protein [Candidatus Levybacteria bacterium]
MEIHISDRLRGIFLKKNSKEAVKSAEEALKQTISDGIKHSSIGRSEISKKGFAVIMFNGRKSEKACLSYMEKCLDMDPAVFYVLSKTEELDQARHLIGRFKARWDGWMIGDAIVGGKSRGFAFTPIYRTTSSNDQKKQ